MRTLPAVRPLILAWALTPLLTGCGGGTGPTQLPPPPPPPPPPPAPVVARVVISPRGLTLPISGQAQLAASASDANGASVPGAVVSWSTQNQTIASVSTNGLVSGNALGQTLAIAATQGKADTVAILVADNFALEVSPLAASADIGKTAQFTVVAKDGSGNPIITPPVSWSSASPAIGTVSNGGVATGVSAGVTVITARAGQVVSLPVTFTVRDTSSAAGACFGIAGVNTFEASIDYGFKAVGEVSDGGFTIDADDNGHMKATMTRFSNGPLIAGWAGDNTGTASVTQKKTSGPNFSTLSGGGQMVPMLQKNPTVTMVVDLRACTYRLLGLATLNALLTEPNGSKTNSDQPVASIQFSGSLGDWRNGLVDFGGTLPTQSSAWFALNPDKSALAVFGFAQELGGKGQGSGGYVVIKKP